MSSWFKNKKQDSGEDSTVLDAMRHARKKIADLEEELARYKNLEVFSYLHAAGQTFCYR